MGIQINYETVVEYYIAGLWDKDAVRKAAAYGYITSDECEKIIELYSHNEMRD